MDSGEREEDNFLPCHVPPNSVLLWQLGWTLLLSGEPQALQAIADFAGHSDHGFDQAQINLQLPFIFGQIPLAVGLSEDSPVRSTQINGVLQTLEYQIAVLTTESVPAKRSKGQCMGRVVGKVKSARQAEIFAPCIFQPCLTRCHQAAELLS